MGSLCGLLVKNIPKFREEVAGEKYYFFVARASYCASLRTQHVTKAPKPSPRGNLDFSEGEVGGNKNGDIIISLGSKYYEET